MSEEKPIKRFCPTCGAPSDFMCGATMDGWNFTCGKHECLVNMPNDKVVQWEEPEGAEE